MKAVIPPKESSSCAVNCFYYLTCFPVCRLDFSEAVTILVGEEEERYILHQNAAVQSSDFLATAMNGRWLESEDKIIRLPDIEPGDFKVYANWLYTRELTIEANGGLGTLKSIGSKVNVKYGQIMDLYVLGLFLLDASFRNVIVDLTIRLYDQIHCFPGLESVVYIWSKTPAACPMRQLITRYWATGRRNFRVPDGLPQEFAIDLLREIFTSSNPETPLKYPSMATRCDYHEHDDKLPQCNDAMPTDSVKAAKAAKAAEAKEIFARRIRNDLH